MVSFLFVSVLFVFAKYIVVATQSSIAITPAIIYLDDVFLIAVVFFDIKLLIIINRVD